MVQVTSLHRSIKTKLLCLFVIIILGLAVIIAYTFYSLITKCKPEKIDVVYTWVNGSDPYFYEDIRKYIEHNRLHSDYQIQRFDEKDELRFSLRSLEKFAPWVNHVYIVTNGQIPNWLDLDYEKVTLITHYDIFKWKSHLPTFSSPAIESHLHRIPGLTERFIYFNDDIFLHDYIYPEDFWARNRGFLVYLAWGIPDCAAYCPWRLVGNGQCDQLCMNENCDMDGGDCDHIQKQQSLQSKQTNYSKLMQMLHDKDGKRNNKTLVDIIKFSSKNNTFIEISELIAEHNQRTILKDKIERKRRRVKRGASLIENIQQSELQNQNRIVERNSTSTDAYAKSLQYTNRILNKIYGYQTRRVPAHTPLMIDLNIMKERNRELHSEVYKTSKNRFRNYDDLQFGLSYNYHLIHKRKQLTIEQIFNEIDLDRNGKWEVDEMRTILTKLYDLPFTENERIQHWDLLRNCTKTEHPPMTLKRDEVINCPLLKNLLETHPLTGHRPKYKYELITNIDRHLHFKMLTSNKTEVLAALDDVRRETRKFVCLNDNLDPGRFMDNLAIKYLIKEFYKSQFPFPSKFELVERINKYYNVAEMDAARRSFFLNGGGITLFGLICILYTIKKKFLMGVRRIFMWIVLKF